MKLQVTAEATVYNTVVFEHEEVYEDWEYARDEIIAMMEVELDSQGYDNYEIEEKLIDGWLLELRIYNGIDRVGEGRISAEEIS